MDIFDIFDMVSEEKKGFEPLPEGKYQVEIESAMIDEAGEFGPVLKYTLKVTEETKAKNRKLWVNRKLEANSLWKVRQDFDALGFGEVSSKNARQVIEEMPGKIATIHLSYAPNKTNPDKPWQNIEFIAEEQLPF